VVLWILDLSRSDHIGDTILTSISPNNCSPTLFCVNCWMQVPQEHIRQERGSRNRRRPASCDNHGILWPLGLSCGLSQGSLTSSDMWWSMISTRDESPRGDTIGGPDRLPWSSKTTLSVLNVSIFDLSSIEWTLLPFERWCTDISPGE
jgi:hypothetical protein